MGFDEDIRDYSPGLILEFATLCHHGIPFRQWRGTLKNSEFEGRRLGLSGCSIEPSLCVKSLETKVRQGEKAEEAEFTGCK